MPWDAAGDVDDAPTSQPAADGAGDLSRFQTAWTLAAVPGAIGAASYLAATNAKQFRLLVDVLADEQVHRLTGVAHDELPGLVLARLAAAVGEDRARELIAPEAFPLESRMRQLVAWGTCEAWQDQARTEADFLRNRERYQLTEAGAVVNRLAREIDAGVGAASTAAVLAPPILHEQLVGASAAIGRGDTDAAATSLALVQTTLADMARTAATWQSRLAAALGGAPDQSKVERLLETIIAYVEMWGSGVDVFSGRIVAATRAFAAVDDATWRALAFPRVGSAADEATVAGVVAELKATIDVLARWFDGPDSQAARLRRQIRDAVTPLLRSHRTLLAVGGVVSRRADLLRLARALEAEPTEGDAWRLWATATGLYPARHLGLLSPDLQQPAQTPSWEAAPVPIERRLRTQGPRALAGRAARIVDTSAQRAVAKARAARDRATLAEAEAALATRSSSVLSEWGALSQGEADLLLDMVSAARARPHRAGGVLVGVSSDGRWTLRLVPVTPPRSAVLRMPSGRLVLADALVEIVR